MQGLAGKVVGLQGFETGLRGFGPPWAHQPSNLEAQPSNLGAQASNLGAQPSNLGAQPPNLEAQSSNLGAQPRKCGAQPRNGILESSWTHFLAWARKLLKMGFWTPPGAISWPGFGNRSKWLSAGLLEPFLGLGSEIAQNGLLDTSWSHFLAWVRKSLKMAFCRPPRAISWPGLGNCSKWPSGAARRLRQVGRRRRPMAARSAAHRRRRREAPPRPTARKSLSAEGAIGGARKARTKARDVQKHEAAETRMFPAR